MITKVFLDTNVLVDYAVSNRPGHEEVTKMLKHLVEHLVVLVISPASLFTLTYLLEKSKWPHHQVKSWLASFSQLVELAHTTHEDILNAAKSSISDIEDALMLMTAISANCDLFITQNLSDFPNSMEGLIVQSPIEVLKEIK